MVKQIKKRPPRIFIDQKGRYVKLNGKKVYIKSNISNKQLVRVINNFEKRKRRMRRNKKQKTLTEQEQKEHEELEKLNKETGKSFSQEDLAKLLFYIQTNRREDEARRQLPLAPLALPPPARPAPPLRPPPALPPIHPPPNTIEVDLFGQTSYVAPNLLEAIHKRTQFQDRESAAIRRALEESKENVKISRKKLN